MKFKKFVPGKKNPGSNFSSWHTRPGAYPYPKHESVDFFDKVHWSYLKKVFKHAFINEIYVNIELLRRCPEFKFSGAMVPYLA